MLLYNRLHGALLCLIQALTKLKTLTYHRYEPALSVLNIRLSIYLIIPFLFHVLPFKASAQEAGPVASPSYRIPEGGLRIGDQIPEELWNLPLQVVNHPEGKETITLNDYRGKLIILDFWATWCSNCISAMPEVHKLEKSFGNEMVVIPISYEPKTKVAHFLKENKTIKEFSLTSITEDTMLSKAFSHSLVPHYVWISPNGVFRSATSNDMINNTNVILAIQNQGIVGRIKRDIDLSKPIFVESDKESNMPVKYSVFLKGINDGLPSGTKLRHLADGRQIGLAITNTPLFVMCHILAYNLIPKFSEKQLYVEQKLKRMIPFTLDDVNKGNRDTVLYSLDVINPGRDTVDLYRTALQVLNIYAPFKAEIKNRKTACLILKANEQSSKLITKEGAPTNTLFSESGTKVLTNSPIGSLVTWLNGNLSIPLILDETNITENIDITLNSGRFSLVDLQKQLQAYGLVLERASREIPFLEISSKI